MPTALANVPGVGVAGGDAEGNLRAAKLAVTNHVGGISGSNAASVALKILRTRHEQEWNAFLSLHTADASGYNSGNE